MKNAADSRCLIVASHANRAKGKSMDQTASSFTLRKEGQIRPLLEHQLLTGIGSSFSDLIEALPFQAHLKDAQTGKYILSNCYDVQSLGLASEKDLIGLTAYDLFSERGIIVKSNPGADISRWKKLELERIEKLEYKAMNTKRPCRHRGAQCLINGFVRFEDVIKVPIPDCDHKKIIAILTFCNNVTFHYNLFDIFQLYRQYYADKEAVRLLLKYLQIDHYFLQLPTVRELQVFLALDQHSSRKRIAKLLNISHHTVASHLQHLKESKLTTPDFNEVLLRLHKTPADGSNSAYA